MAYLLAGLAYVFAAIVCARVFAATGERNPCTIGDSWTGDNALDLWSIILWPIGLAVAFALLVGNAAARILVR